MKKSEIRQLFDEYITLEAEQDKLIRRINDCKHDHNITGLEWLLRKLTHSKKRISCAAQDALNVMFYQDGVGDEIASDYSDAVSFLQSYLSGDGEAMSAYDHWFTEHLSKRYRKRQSMMKLRKLARFESEIRG